MQVRKGGIGILVAEPFTASIEAIAPIDPAGKPDRPGSPTADTSIMKLMSL